MQVTPHMLLIVCPLVFLAGFVDSIGGGGGLISLPAYLFAGVPPHTALATNKLSSSIGTTVSATRLFKYMDLPLAGACVICSILGSWGGSLPGTAGQRRAGALYAVAGSARSGLLRAP